MTGPCPRPECGGEVHTDGWGNPTRCPHEQLEPRHLTREDLQPLVAAIHRREWAAFTGANLILPPLPKCPTCAHAPTEMAASQDSFDRWRIAFKPCGHAFTADGEAVAEAAHLARQQPEAPLPEDGTRPEQPPQATPLEEAQATIESLRYQIRRAREALSSNEPSSADAAITRVRALHRQECGLCAHCTREDGVPWPCPTIQALDGGTP